MKIAQWGGPPCPPGTGGLERPPHQHQPFFMLRCVFEEMIAGIRKRDHRPARSQTSSGDGKRQGERQADDRWSPARPPPRSILWTRGLAGNSHPSGAPKADTDLLTLRQDRHLAVAGREAQHLGHGLGILFDIPINDRQPFFSLGLPGPPRKGSVLLPEDDDLSGHGPPPEEVSR